MNVFGPNSLSYYLFYISRILALGILTFLSFVLLSFIAGNFEIQENTFSIAIPFTGGFIKGIYTSKIISSMSIAFLLYMAFFYMLSRVFSRFRAEPLFTASAVKELHLFATLNLVGSPIAFIIIHLLLLQQTNVEDVLSYILHLLIGIFFLFLTAIFKKGFSVQSENDLTI